MRIVSFTMGILGAVLFSAGLFGILLPSRFDLRGDVIVAATPDAVFARLLDVESFSKWRSGLKHAERLPAHLARPGWRESHFLGNCTLEIIESKAPSTLVVRSAESNLPFNGLWNYQLAAEGTQTRIRLNFRGEVPNPFVRLFFRYAGVQQALLTTSLYDLSHQ